MNAEALGGKISKGDVCLLVIRLPNEVCKIQISVQPG